MNTTDILVKKSIYIPSEHSPSPINFFTLLNKTCVFHCNKKLTIVVRCKLVTYSLNTRDRLYIIRSSIFIF